MPLNAQTKTTNIQLIGSYLQVHTGGGIAYFHNRLGIEFQLGVKKVDHFFEISEVSTTRSELNLIWRSKSGKESTLYAGTGIVSWSGTTNIVKGEVITSSNKGFSIFGGYDLVFGVIGIGGRIGYENLGDLEFEMVEAQSGFGVSMGAAKSILKAGSLLIHFEIKLVL